MSIDDKLLRQQEEEDAASESRPQEEAEGNGDGNDDNTGNGNKANDEDNSNGGGGRPSASDRLAELANENISLFFKDQYDKAHAVVHITDHYEIVRVESNKFKRYLSRLFYDNENQIIKAESINNVIQVLQAKAEFEGQTIPLSLRVTWHNDGNMYYDLTNEKWQYIKISKEGHWQLINNETPNPLFIRYNQVAQVVPGRD